MFKSNHSLSKLQFIFDHKFGAKGWIDWEPETILFEAGPDEFSPQEPLLKEKIIVLQVLNHAMNAMLAMPEFLIWTVSVANNEPADFEHVWLPTSLELAWTIIELKKIGAMIGPGFVPSEELIDVVAYFLNEEGFSEPVEPFEFVPQAKLHSGQTKDDTLNKKLAISKYINHMNDLSKD